MEADKHMEYMHKAIQLAKHAMDSLEGGPFGAVVVRNGKVIGESGNTTKRDCDPTAHAEVMAIRNACKNINSLSLKGSMLFTSCYPCPMCMGAIYWAEIGSVVYAATNNDTVSAGFDDHFIYAELNLADNEKSLELNQILHKEGINIFEEWKLKHL